MAAVDYLNFDLEIERVDEGYRVASDSPVGQASAAFSLPFSETELEGLLEQLEQADASRGEIGRAFGARLFEAVFDGEVRACLRGSLDEAERLGLGLRIRLRLGEAPELADLPWEYLYHTSLDRYLALSALTPLVRYLELPERIRPLGVTAPLRILVVISSPRDQAPIDAEGEWTRLRVAMRELVERGLVVLERVPATLAALQDQLRCGDYHTLYYIGHGAFDERGQAGRLLFEDGEGSSDRVSGQDLGLLLHDHRSLRLAVLNACEGARTSHADLFAGVTQCLVRQGLPAVIAMQFVVSCEAAAMLARAFYGAVADGYPVDAALAEGRKALFIQGNRDEWGTPVLYMRAPDGKLFDLAAVAQAPGGSALARGLTEAPLIRAGRSEMAPGHDERLSATSGRRSASRDRQSGARDCMLASFPGRSRRR
jgi:hypothetical protein